MRKDELVPDNAPFRAAVFALGELAVEPVLLASSHDTAAGVVVDTLNVVSVVAWQVMVSRCISPIRFMNRPY